MEENSQGVLRIYIAPTTNSAYLLLLLPVPALDPTRRGVLAVRVLERRRDGQVGHVVPVELQVLQRREQALCRVRVVPGKYEQERRRGDRPKECVRFVNQ